MDPIVILRLAGLLASYWGYYRLLCRKTPVPAAFIPLLVLCGQSVALFFAGLAGVLYPAACVLYFGGMAAGAASFAAGGRPARYPAGLWVLAALTAYAAFLLHGKVFAYNDDFSHWALMVRVMLGGDALPTAADTLITFPSYPPGTACLIYYVCRMVTGTATCEWGIMMAQAALLLSCVAPLADMAGRRLWYALPAALVLAWFAIGYDVQLYELMVDSVLPMLAFACMMLIAERSQNGSGVWEWMLLTPLAMLTLTKNSALIFVAFVYLVYLAAMRPRTLRAWLRAAMLLAPLTCLVIWRQHAAAVTPGMERSLHAMSGAWFKRILSDKTMLDVLDTLSMYKDRLLGERYALLLCALPMAMMALLRICGVRLDRLTRMLPWLQIAFFGAYHVGLAGMYIFSMHITEAVKLAQYDRYAGSVTLLMTGVFLLFAFGCAHACSTRPRAGRAMGAAVLLSAAVCVGVGRPPVQALVPADQSGTLRVRLETILQQCPRDEGLRYMLAIDSPELDATPHYCTRYLLWTTQLRTANAGEKKADGSTIYDLAWYEVKSPEYDYLIVLDHYDEVDAFIAAHYPDHTQQAVIPLR